MHFLKIYTTTIKNPLNTSQNTVKKRNKSTTRSSAKGSCRPALRTGLTTKIFTKKKFNTFKSSSQVRDPKHLNFIQLIVILSLKPTKAIPKDTSLSYPAEEFWEEMSAACSRYISLWWEKESSTMDSVKMEITTSKDYLLLLCLKWEKSLKAYSKKFQKNHSRKKPKLWILTILQSVASTKIFQEITEFTAISVD